MTQALLLDLCKMDAQTSHSDTFQIPLHGQEERFMFEPEMPVVKRYIKMGIISTDTLERSENLSVELLNIQTAKKKETAKQKTPCNQNYRRLAGTWQNSAISSPESAGVTPLLASTRVPGAEQRPCRGRSSLGPRSPPRAGDGTVTGRLPRGASRLCLSDLPHSSARSSSFHLFIVLVCVAAITPRARCCNRFP